MDIAEFVVIRIVRYGYAELQFMQYSIHTLKNHSKFTFLKITSFTFSFINKSIIVEIHKSLFFDSYSINKDFKENNIAQCHRMLCSPNLNNG